LRNAVKQIGSYPWYDAQLGKALAQSIIYYIAITNFKILRKIVQLPSKLN